MAPRFALVPARWLAPDSGLTNSDRLTLCILCIWVNRERGDCWPSVATIAEHAALSENTVRSSIKRLAALGALEIERRSKDTGDNDSNLYTILGYDPPAKKGGGGTSTIAVPLLQPLREGTANGAVEVPQPLHPNSSTENKEVNKRRLAAGPDGPPSAPRNYNGPLDRWGQPIPDIPDFEPLTEEQRADIRAQLAAAGIGPK